MYSLLVRSTSYDLNQVNKESRDHFTQQSMNYLRRLAAAKKSQRGIIAVFNYHPGMDVKMKTYSA